jgi:integrase
MLCIAGRKSILEKPQSSHILITQLGSINACGGSVRGEVVRASGANSRIFVTPGWNRAGLSDVHPHRFRDTFAVDMLARGASPYDVVKLLGDTVATMEKHYAPFVKLRDRVRNIMENGEGLARTDCTLTARSECGTGRIH